MSDNNFDLYEFDSIPTYTEDELTYFFRELNTKILLDEYKFIPDINNLDRKTIRKCRKLSKKGMIVFGSTILKLYGLLDRNSIDIDVGWDIDKAKNEKIIDERTIISCFDYERIINKEVSEENIINRYKVEHSIYGTLDIFDINKISNEYITYEGINHMLPLHILKVKFSYYREKDTKDFNEIRRKLNI